MFNFPTKTKRYRTRILHVLVKQLNTILIGDGTKFSPKIFSGDVLFDSTNIGELKIQSILTNKHFKAGMSDNEKIDVAKTKLKGDLNIISSGCK